MRFQCIAELVTHSFKKQRRLQPDSPKSAPAEMVKFLWIHLLLVAASLEFTASKWWSPYKWRDYWQDWWQKLEKGQTQPEQNKHEILINGEG